MKFGEIKLSEKDSQMILKELRGSTTNKNRHELLRRSRELYKKNKSNKENT